MSSVGPLVEGLKLAKVSLDNSILLDVFNLARVSIERSKASDIAYTGKVADQLNNVVSHISRKATELAEAIDVGRVLLQELECGVDEVLEVLVLHLDDVSSRNGRASTGNDHGRRGRKCQRQEGEED